MRTWNDKLFLDTMPGRNKPGRPQGDFGLWLREMKENGIQTVVCLAPEEQVAAESPEYAQWRRRQLNERQEPAPTGSGQFKLIDIPIDDFHTPEPFGAAHFWKAAREIAERIENDDRVFIHCGAGIGRTGMFAVAVLMELGYEYGKALEDIKAVGSYPEKAAQREFVRQGRAGINEH